ncbi:organomercurial lyase [Streptomyces sp. NPDC001941]|uniref:organomercurial lyase n=1 Tax=Streptomyces sp. NPDC001941 TaxID=3154659 RepID=UPI00332CE2B9
MPQARIQELSNQLVATWASPQGVKLMAAGATLVGGLLERGPLTTAQAAQLLGWPEGEVHERFHGMKFDLETDGEGRITGAGVSLDDKRPHTMEIQGARRYGWCAMDVLMFPVVFKEPNSRVTSRCAASGEPISLVVTPDGVRDLSSGTVAVTLAPSRGGEYREVFCDRVNFYATPELAAEAADRDHDLEPCTVDEAWEVGKRLAGLF